MSYNVIQFQASRVFVIYWYLINENETYLSYKLAQAKKRTKGWKSSQQSFKTHFKPETLKTALKR